MVTHVQGLIDPQDALVTPLGEAVRDAIVVPILRENDGILIEARGGDTVSCFEHAQDALRAAVRIQQKLDALNMSQQFKSLVLMRIGLHSGEWADGNGDSHGDTVAVAACLESRAMLGEILFSEDTRQALSDPAEFQCRLVEPVVCADRMKPCQAYKAIWAPDEIEQPIAQDDVHLSRPTSKLTLLLVVMIPLLLVLAVSLWQSYGEAFFKKPTRTIDHHVTTLLIPVKSCEVHAGFGSV
ncbi:MAG: adenylate/guanylate cyclase domain-containing protein [Methylophilaceae bacterium]|nr:adenylate/guanylate cyclase domain-containing protein [Methylophilaceae bacterium]